MSGLGLEDELLSGATLLALYALSTILFALVDITWIVKIAHNFYHKQLKGLMSKDFRQLETVLFYGIYPLGLVYFAIAPGVAEKDVVIAALNGALFGFFAYMTYNLTNRITLKKWSQRMVLVDVTWGTFVSSTVAAITYWVYSLI